jgi:hypothetical protein
MDHKRIDASPREFVDKGVWIRNHQMRFKRQAGHCSQRTDDHRPHRKIGHEMPVHDVRMDTVRAGALSLQDLIAEMCEIGR